MRERGWQQVIVMLRLTPTHGPRESRVRVAVPAWVHPEAPGLAVHGEIRDVDGAVAQRGAWVVTHLASSFAVVRGIGSRRAAFRAAIELATLGDWTRSRTALERDRGFLAVAHRVARELMAQYQTSPEGRA
jgi:hypothetical protein